MTSMAYRLLQGNVLDVLPTLPANSVQCCITSPPYFALRDYGVEGQIGMESTPQEYVATLVRVFSEVHRVLRDDGTLWLNLGDSYAGSGGRGLQRGRAEGRPAALRRHGARAGVNGGGRDKGDRTAAVPVFKPKDLMLIPFRVALALQADGWWVRSDIIWAKPNPMPESVTDRPTKSHEYIFLLTKSARYYYDNEAVKEAATSIPSAFRNSSRYTEQGRAPSNDNHNGAVWTGDFDSSSRNLRDVWTITTQSYSGAHFATFPVTIPERCIRAGTKGGDTVLDPFAGSGTTLAVAQSLGRDSIGIELNPAYIELAHKRIADTQPALFGL